VERAGNSLSHQRRYQWTVQEEWLNSARTVDLASSFILRRKPEPGNLKEAALNRNPRHCLRSVNGAGPPPCKHSWVTSTSTPLSTFLLPCYHDSHHGILIPQCSGHEMDCAGLLEIRPVISADGASTHQLVTPYPVPGRGWSSSRTLRDYTPLSKRPSNSCQESTRTPWASVRYVLPSQLYPRDWRLPSPLLAGYAIGFYLSQPRESTVTGTLILRVPRGYPRGNRRYNFGCQGPCLRHPDRTGPLPMATTTTR